MKRFYLILGLLGLAAAPGFTDAGTEGAAFLDIPVGAGPAAMGSAYTALATDAYAPAYNPAGLGFIDGAQLAGQHLDHVESLHEEHLSYVQPLSERHAIGLSGHYLGSGNLTRTDAAGTPLGDFSSYYGALGISYGRALSDRIALGITGKWIGGKLDNHSANAYAGDIGALARLNKKVDVAAAITNFGTDFKFIGQKDALPAAGKLGVAVRPHSAWTLALEGVFRRSKQTDVHTGLEFRPLPALALRAGYRTDTTRELSASAGLTMGAGLKFWGQEFAYAWLPLGDLGTINYFSLILRFNKFSENAKNLNAPE